MSKNALNQSYWRSLEELADTPEFRALVQAEFPNAAAMSGPSRRQFLKLMGASLALAGVAACRWPKEKIAPFAQRPEGRTPGVPVQYATAMEIGGAAQGLLVTSYDGRPIKIEGNPLHPTNRGATDAIAQASVLELYDPDRLQTCRQRGADGEEDRNWEEFTAFAKDHFAALRQRQGKGLAVITELSWSPSMTVARKRFQQAFPLAEWCDYEPICNDNERLGTALLFGQRPCRPLYALDRADVIVCFDADLLGDHPAALKHTRDFVAGRDVDRDGRRRDTGGPMNRLYVAESTYTITGGMADERFVVPGSAIPAALCELTNALIDAGLTVPDSLRQLRDGFELSGVGEVLGARATAALAQELLAHGGRSVIAVGWRQPVEVHALAHALNVALGNTGQTVHYAPEPEEHIRPPSAGRLKVLAADLGAGKIDTLLILGGNPAYDAPAELEFGKLLAGVQTSIHLTLHENETSRLCTWRLPRAHYLETWGDARAYDGTISVVQPLIEPLYGGKSAIELLALVLGEETTSGYDILRQVLQQQYPSDDFEGFWRRVLHDGVVSDSQWPVERPAPRGGTWVETVTGLATQYARFGAAEFELVFLRDSRLHDGRFANNGWLQEMPDPLTKLTWDNAALISPRTAERLGLNTGDVVTLEVRGRRLDIPVLVQPGQHDRSIAVALGFGREHAGRVGDGVGFNAYTLRTTDALHIARGASLTKTGRRYELATTQDHQAIDSAVGRRETRERVGELVREAPLTEYLADPEFARHAVHHLPLVSLWQEHEFPGQRRWAMAIDLNKCTGCGACVVACQAENNVPVVGKDEVRRGREMHWLRVDRYFKGAPDAPQVVHQPVACHHCELAPCEQVCPVAATVHSQEGLNDMVYNRCVGTRYCSNNCPYKVRRFNWFNNWKHLTDVRQLAFNPEVTVRSRGVMEKCTFCIQRINTVKIAAKNDGRPIKDGEITPACAQACPAQAIVFGDLSDPDSRVAQLHARDRAYAMLAELNIKPRTKYLAKLRNPRIAD